jgi:metal-responsive CopG/Arc/MetJ family transcriptional regulator
MKPVAKVAVSLPRRTLALVERARRRSGQSRSAVVAEALEAWLQAVSVGEADRKYAEAYLRDPERVDERAAIAAGAVSTWEPWE